MSKLTLDFYSKLKGVELQPKEKVKEPTAYLNGMEDGEIRDVVLNALGVTPDISCEYYVNRSDDDMYQLIRWVNYKHATVAEFNDFAITTRTKGNVLGRFLGEMKTRFKDTEYKADCTSYYIDEKTDTTYEYGSKISAIDKVLEYVNSDTNYMDESDMEM